MNTDRMKEHLYKLILEQHNQEVLFDELLDKGIDMHEICVDNLEIIFDILGFPEDNSYEYYLFNEQPQHGDETIGYPEPKEPYFNRWNLREEYFKVLKRISEEENMFVVADSIETVQGADEEATERILREFIDWLYREKRNWKRRKH